MGDVSCRALDLYFDALRRRGIPERALVEGTTLDVAALEDPGRRIPWDDFVALTERLGVLVGGDVGLLEVGRGFLEVPRYVDLGSVLGFVAEPRHLYHFGLQVVGQSLFIVPVITITSDRPDAVDIVVEIPEPYRTSRAFVVLIEGVLAAYPTWLGLPHALVLRDGDARRARYRVRVDPMASGLRARLHQRMALLKAAVRPEAFIAQTMERSEDWRVLMAEVRAQRGDLARRVLELEQVRDELGRSEAFYRSLAESAPDLVVRLDRDGIVRYVNHRLPQLLDRNLLDLLPGDEREALQNILATVVLDGRRADYTATVPGFDGVPRSWQARLAPIVTDGVIVGCTLIARDVTEQRRAAEERLELERQLLHAQKLESLGLLAGGIAHDFNNLLTGVRANVEMLLLDEAGGSEDTHRRLRRIARAATRAAELTDRILAYSGRPPFVVRPFDLSPLLEELADLLVAALPKAVRIERTFDDDLPAVEGDPAQVQQVAMNLITNAAEAMGGREGAVRVSTTARLVHDGDSVDNVLSEPLRPGRYVVLEVSDEGPGLDPAVRARMFDPFYSTKGQGRGLGLSTVIGIVRGHGGALEVDSVPGVGTTFRAWFPACEATPQPSGDPSVDRPSGEGRGVLVIDDEELVRQTAADLLDAYGFSVTVAADGQEALQVVSDDPDAVDVVLLDWSMPGMSGADVFEALRARWPEIPIVLCSAYDLHTELETLWPRGLAAFVRKPWFGRQLAEVLRSRARLAPNWA